MKQAYTLGSFLPSVSYVVKLPNNTEPLNHSFLYSLESPLSGIFPFLAMHLLLATNGCMDPLKRKVNTDESIQGLNIGNPITIDKLCAYADDIVFIIKDNTHSKTS